MGEIADLRAGALDDVAIGVEQQIDLAGQRRDVLGKIAADALGLAAADRGDALAQHAQRPQPEAHRQRGRAEQRHRQDQEGRRAAHIRNARSAVSITSALAATWTRKRPSSPASISRSIMRSGLSPGPIDIAARDAVALRLRVVVAEARQLVANSEREVRISGCGSVEPGDLPIPAGEGELELRIDDRRARRAAARRRRRDIGDQRLEIDAELLVEIRLAPSAR